MADRLPPPESSRIEVSRQPLSSGDNDNDIVFRPCDAADPAIAHLCAQLDAELDVFYPPAEGIRGRRRKLTPAELALVKDYTPAPLVYLLALRPRREATAASNSSESEHVAAALGCIAFRPLPAHFFPDHAPSAHVAELTRMYVAAAARGTGLAAKLVVAMERHARTAHGIDVFVLRTGVRQVPALKLYRRAGYRARGLYGTNIGRGPEEAGGATLAFEKALVEEGEV